MEVIHYLPQDPIDKYEPLINRNYNIAISYYKQKRFLLESSFKQATGQSFNVLKNELNNVILQKWQSIIQEIKTAIVRNPKVQNHQSPGAYMVNQASILNSAHPLTRQILEYINSANARGRGVNIGSMLGNTFEPFLKQEVENSKVIQLMQQYVANNSSYLIGQLTGDLTSKSALIGANKSTKIRPDALISFDASLSLNKTENQILTTGMPPRAVELQSLLDLSQISLEYNTVYNRQVSKMLVDYLNSNTYGFSIKYWNKESGKTFAKSKEVQQELNRVFRYKKPPYGIHSWETKYAEVYSNWEISKNLINIIGPYNVALISGSGFEWMSDFLQSHILRMSFQHRKTRAGDKKLPFDSTREGRPTIETTPEVRKTDIYIKTRNNIFRGMKIQDSLGSSGKQIEHRLSIKST